jgi:O-acetyl-ADP-ribose deacetylase (regulator of RNase III)
MTDFEWNYVEIRSKAGKVTAGPFLRQHVMWTPDQAEQLADCLRAAAHEARKQIGETK